MFISVVCRSIWIRSLWRRVCWQIHDRSRAIQNGLCRWFRRHQLYLVCFATERNLILIDRKTNKQLSISQFDGRQQFTWKILYFSWSSRSFRSGNRDYRRQEQICQISPHESFRCIWQHFSRGSRYYQCMLRRNQCSFQLHQLAWKLFVWWKACLDLCPSKILNKPTHNLTASFFQKTK